MARFNCTACFAEGELSALDVEQRCPHCGASDGVRVTMRMDDYPAGHPFWKELVGASDECGASPGSGPDKMEPT